MKFTNSKLLLLIVQLFINSLLFGETINVYFDLSTPQHEFAANDIKKALEDNSYTVVFRDLSTLDSTDQGKKVVIALSGNENVSNLLSDQGGIVPGELGEQAYALITTSATDLSFWILGGDNNGAMYGGLQIAEYINFDGFSGSYTEEESPYKKNRGIKFNIPFDAESSTYARNNTGTSHKHAIRNVWDMSFWQTWFDEMARNRYNVLSLWSSHPFTSMVNMEDEYPGVAIQNVQGYAEAGLPMYSKSMSIDEKVKFWQDVMQYGVDRGFDIYMITWNIFVYGANGKHGITEDMGNQNTRDYMQRCVVRFLETYPNLKGLGVTAGENLDGTDSQKEEWLWDTYGEGVMEYAQANPQRNLTFIHRVHTTNWSVMEDYFAPLISLPNIKFDLSNKYSLAHMHGAIKPDFGTDKIIDICKAQNLEMWLNLRNDDFFFLHWADPAFARNYVSNFPAKATGIYIGSDGWTFSRVFTAKDSYYRDQNTLSIQKTWYMQKIWGRIAYNPSVSDELFKKHLALKYSEVNTNTLFEAWSKASAAMVLANEQVTDSWRRDATWYPEMWSYSVDGGGQYNLNDTKKAEAMPGSDLCDISATVTNNCNGKISAWDNINKIEQLAQDAKVLLESLSSGSNIDLRYNLNDIKSLANLSLYSANKYRAAMHSLAGNQSQALDAMAAAYCYWIQYTIAMDELYIGVDLQRNRNFSDWHEYDDNVLQDYIALGGDPNIGCGNIAVSGSSLENCPDQMYIGASQQQTASVLPAYATNRTVSWSSSDTSIIIVDADGNLTAVSEGSAAISVVTADGGFTDNCTITVAESPGCEIPYKDNRSFTLNLDNTNTSYGPYDVSCISGVNISIDVLGSSGLDPQGSNNEDAFSVSVILDGSEIYSTTDYGSPDGSIVKITNLDVRAGNLLEINISGYVTAASESYTFDNVILSDAGTIVVPVSGVSIDNCPDIELTNGITHRFTVTISPSDATDQSLSWSSSNSLVATVDSSGIITTRSAGETIISVATMDGNFSDECAISVDKEVNITESKLGSQIIEVYPNPASEVLNFRFSETGYEKKINFYRLQLLGQLLYSKTTNNSNPIINLSEFSTAGMLFVKVISEETIASFKVFIESSKNVNY